MRKSHVVLVLMAVVCLAGILAPVHAAAPSANPTAELYLANLSSREQQIYSSLDPVDQRRWLNSLMDFEDAKKQILKWDRLATGAAIGAAAPWALALTGVLSIAATPLAALALTGATAGVGAAVQGVRMYLEYRKAKAAYDDAVADILRAAVIRPTARGPGRGPDASAPATSVPRPVSGNGHGELLGVPMGD